MMTINNHYMDFLLKNKLFGHAAWHDKMEKEQSWYI